MPPPERPHDVLAAEEFALPAPDPRLHYRPLRLPEDPAGIAEPHDVLAAEEFALPASATIPGAGAGGHSERRHLRVRLVAGAGAALLVAVGLLRRFFHIA